MHIRKLLILVLLGLSLSAAADFTTITAAYEVPVSDLRLPGTVGGTLAFKQCSECETQTLRVTGQTRYVLNDQDLALVDFKEQIGDIGNPQDETVTVLHHLESNTITAIKARL